MIGKLLQRALNHLRTIHVFINVADVCFYNFSIPYCMYICFLLTTPATKSHTLIWCTAVKCSRAFDEIKGVHRQIKRARPQIKNVRRQITRAA